MKKLHSGLLGLCSVLMLFAFAQKAAANSAAEMAKKMQDPLANIKAIQNEFNFSFNAGDKEDDMQYGWQIQPVYAMPFEEKGFNLISRAIIPVVGAPAGGQAPILGEPLPPDGDHTWGLSDTMLQFYFNPRSDAAWKWGIGPMITIPTRTDDKLKGPGWGIGPVGVLVGNFTEKFNTAILLGHTWGEEDGYSTTLLQPMFFYNLPNAMSLQYLGMITYDWNAEDSSNAWTVPIGLGIAKMFALKGGHGLELHIGPYYNAQRPDGAAEWTIKAGLNWIIP